MDIGPLGYFFTRRSKNPFSSLSLSAKSESPFRKQFTFVANRCIRPNRRLIHIRPFELRENGRCNGQTADLIILGQCEAKLLGVVVDIFDALELQTDESLVSTLESRLGGDTLQLCFTRGDCILCLGFCVLRCSLDFCGIVTLAVVIVPSTSKQCSSSGIE